MLSFMLNSLIKGAIATTGKILLRPKLSGVSFCSLLVLG